MEWVGEANDGAEAVELVARTSPDIVLMDLSMPGTDGVTATQQVVSAFSSARVLVLTTSADPALVRRSLNAGAAAVVDKDGNPATVLGGIRDVARAARLDRVGLTDLTEQAPPRPRPATRCADG